MNDQVLGPLRLDVVLSDAIARSSELHPAFQEFEALLRTSRGEASEVPQSLKAEIVDYVMPRVSDASIFHGGKFTSLLKDISEGVDDSLFGEEMSAKIRGVINEELNRYWAIQDQRHEGARW
ncbi:hypothetical protein GCM10007276_11900 [Agaricicola taiwanensis]|uniref:Uncharacterized protein n=1 Tax=Agaricicola taiwanensis TaxID=591372 RepID=A0A8J2VLB7_9RHOB|nr:hypothetical protein [Agaricicola taiwanensis]GGE36055.1 hypothetical protein GCM10007276_11900 [Agaricicola taiwanensis]